MRVEVKNGKFEKAIRIFKRKTLEEGIVQEVRSRQQYVKPSDKRRLAKKAAIARYKRDNLGN